VSLRKLFKDN